MTVTRSGLTPLTLFPFVIALVAGVGTAVASQVKKPFVTTTASGALAYEADSRGNRIPDFSGAGYRGGGVPLPTAVARVLVSPTGRGDGPRIQAAIDYVAQLPPDAHGLRGAVQLARGRYEITHQLRIRTSGVVVRGAGPGEDGTVLVASGNDRRTLIEITGRTDFTKTGLVRTVTDAYVPVGATTLTLDRTEGLRIGDRVIVERPSTKEWIEAIGMHDAPGRQPFRWQPGKMNLSWERFITAINGSRVTFDAPLTTALDRAQGGGTVTTFTWAGRIAEVGVENLRCESAFDPANPRDEEHAWMAISVDATENAWIANVTAVHFVSSAVQLGAGARAITVQDCASLSPISEIGGYRRHSFQTSGQLTLFLRCRAEEGIHDFTTGYLTSGPNVFLDCNATTARGFSGSIGSWASGILFDNVAIDGASLDLDNLESWNQGVGWAAANSVLWNCTASIIHCRRPPTANNWAVGPWAEFWGDGWWDQANEVAHPASLYRAQLAARRGAPALAALAPAKFSVDDSESSTAPSLESVISGPAPSKTTAAHASEPTSLALSHGWLVANHALLTGTEAPAAWWRGWLIPSRAAEMGPALTRFVPGRIGSGLTDDLDKLTDTMTQANQLVFRHHHGLWYDRRRDDHQRVRRANADDWPPFFEQPFARSGQGEAWDRLSRYDLTRFNPWYFRRLHEFATLARAKGRVLVNEMYFQHNVLEAAAHWADSPWRPANCLQETGFPEPPLYRDSDGSAPATPEAGKRVFMAEYFYDVSHPVRRALHRGYIRQCLANLAHTPNVIHTTSAEFSGPLSFMQFWLDVVAEWEAETGRHPLIALSSPKDVQDAILADPKRSALIDVIDLTYWWRLDDGREHAPPGGTALAPRQHEREWRGGRPSATALAGMVREYRERFPSKAVITGLDQRDGWAFVAAGGSFPALPETTDPALRTALARMQPFAMASAKPHAKASRSWTLADSDHQYFIYAANGGDLPLDLTTATGHFAVRQIDPSTGRIREAANAPLKAGGVAVISAPLGAPALFWIVR